MLAGRVYVATSDRQAVCWRFATGIPQLGTPYDQHVSFPMCSSYAPTITFARLSEVDPADLIALMNHPRVRRHLPLAHGMFGPQECARFVAAKEQHWAEHGYGLWAFYVEGAFAGWGGLQRESDDIDLGLVLHPRYWGLGQSLYARLAAEAFDRLGARSVIVLLPISRRHVAALGRAGFVPDGEVWVGEERFRRFRLYAEPKRDS